ncbi:MAG: heparinase II/III family protein [Oligosphaeraceae bacterium]
MNLQPHLPSLALLLAGASLSAATLIDVPNLDFEQGLEHWTSRNAMATAEPRAARSGKLGLVINDTTQDLGSDLLSEPFPVRQGTTYRLTFWARKLQETSQGTAVYIRYFDANGKMLLDRLSGETVLPMEPSSSWHENRLHFRPNNPAIASARIWVHSVNGAISLDALDDFRLEELNADEAKGVALTTLTGLPPLSPQRVAEIAAMLHDEPRGLGFPVSRRDKWDHLPNTTGQDTLIAQAEKFAASEPPELRDEDYLLYNKTGNRTIYEKPYFERRTRLYTLAVAEALENRGRFLPALERDIAAILAERSWVLPAHDASLSNFHQKKFYADLFSSERASDLSTVDYWFQDRLKPETRAAIRREAHRRVIDPYLRSVHGQDMTGHSWMNATHNWNAVCTGNLINCILTLVPDKTTRAEAIAAAERSNQRFLAGFTPDGYCSEGIGYWHYGFGHFLIMGEHVLQETNGRLSFFNHPNLPLIAGFATRIQLSEGIAPAFADCGVNASLSDHYALLIARHWPEALNRRPVPASVLRSAFPIMPLVAFDDAAKLNPQLPEKATFPLRSAFPDAGIHLLRSTTAKGIPFGIAIKGGHNAEHHNHNDVGSFLLAAGTSRLLIDPGAETYTRQTFSNLRYTFNLLNSFGHSVPVVAGKLQRPGRNARGTFTHTSFSDQRDELTLDLAAAYDVPELTALTRTVVLDRAAETITITDRVAFSSPQTFSSALISGAAVATPEPQRLIVSDNRQALDIAVAVDGGPWTAKTERVIRQFDRPGPNRFSVTLDQPVTEAAITFTIRTIDIPHELLSGYRQPDLKALGLAPREQDAITIQAEDFSGQTLPKPIEGDAPSRGVAVESKPGADGKAFKLWDREGHALDWTFAVPKAGRYLLQARACCDHLEGATRLVALDDAQPQRTAFPNTFGWSSAKDDWQNIYPALKGQPIVLTLTPGTHTLTLTNDCGRGLNLDWLRLVPCDN